MEGESRNLQNDFFNAVRKQRSVVNIFLGSGKRLTGRIRSFDKFTLLLDGQYGEQIVFKHAIATVSAAGRHSAEPDAGDESSRARTHTAESGRAGEGD